MYFFLFLLKIVLLFLQFSRQNLQKFLQYFFLFRLFFQTKSSEKSENLTEFFILKVQNRAEKIQQIVALFYENSGQIFTFSFQKTSLHATFFCNQKSRYSAILRRISACFFNQFCGNFVKELNNNRIISKWISAEILMKMTIVLCFSQQRLIVLFHTFFGDNTADADKKTLPCSTVTYRKGGSNSK